MAEKSFPLEGTIYTAEDAALWFATRTSGVYASSQLAVTANGDMTVNVGTGIAWLKYAEYAGVAYANTEAKTLALSTANAYFPRIDRVVIRYSKSENRVYLAVKEGVASSTLDIPAVTRDAGTYEISLAQIHVAANAGGISAENITDERFDSTVCGLMRDGVTGIDTTTIEQNTIAKMEMFMNERQTEFDTWYASIQATLDGDVAANLASNIALCKNDIAACQKGIEECRQELENVTQSGAYPVGSIYMSVNNTSPASLFGGAWEQIKDRFLLSAGNNFSAGAEGGTVSHAHGLGDGYAKIRVTSGGTLLSKDMNGVSWESDRSITGLAAPTSSSTNASVATALGGSTGFVSSLPPYLTVYMWKRVS